MVTTSDPYKNGPMSVGVKYNTNSDTWNTDTFNQMAISGEFRTTNSASLINSNLPYTGHWAEFDGNNDWFQSNSAVQPLYKSGEPWAFGGVVRVNSTPSEGTFFGRSTGWNSGNSNGGIHLGVTADDKLIFQYGNAYNRLQFTGSDTLSTGTDYGFYVDYDGGTTGVSSGSTAQYFSRFRIKQVNLTQARSLMCLDRGLLRITEFQVIATEDKCLLVPNVPNNLIFMVVCIHLLPQR